MAAPTPGNVTTSDYGESIAEPDAPAGALLVFCLTWFEDHDNATIANVGDPIATFSSDTGGSNPVRVRLYSKRKGEGSSGPHAVSAGGGFELVACQAFTGVAAEDPISPAPVGNGGASNPYSLTVPSITAADADSYDAIFSSTWNFPIDEPAGWATLALHSFEIRLIGRVVGAGATGTQEVSRDGDDTGAAARFIIRPEASGEPDPVTGSLAETSPAQTEAVAGSSTVGGALAETTSAQTGSATGAPVITGAIAETSPAQTGQAAGGAIASGALAEIGAAQTGAATGSPGVVGTLEESTPAQASALAGSPRAVGALAGTGAQESPAQTSEAGGSPIVAGAVTETSPAQTEAIVGAPLGDDVTGTIAETAPAQAEAVQGTVRVTGTAATESPSQADALSGAPIVRGAIAEANPAQTESLAGDVAEPETITGALSEVAPAQQETLSGISVVRGAIAETAPAQTEVIASAQEPPPLQPLHVTGSLRPAITTAGSVRAAPSVTGALRPTSVLSEAA